MQILTVGGPAAVARVGGALHDDSTSTFRRTPGVDNAG